MLLTIDHAPAAGLNLLGDGHPVARAKSADDNLHGVGRLANDRGNATADGVLEGAALLGKAAVLLDHAGLVVRMNAAAEALYPAALGWRQGRLFALHRSAQQPLRALIASATLSIPAHRCSTSLTVRLPRLDGDRPLIALAMSLAEAPQALSHCAAAVLFLIDLGRQKGSDPEMLQTAFGLTSAEAQLAGILSNGTDLFKAATYLGVSRSTTRTHLRSIFAKTGTHRQGELVSLLLRVVA